MSVSSWLSVRLSLSVSICLWVSMSVCLYAHVQYDHVRTDVLLSTFLTSDPVSLSVSSHVAAVGLAHLTTSLVMRSEWSLTLDQVTNRRSVFFPFKLNLDWLAIVRSTHEVFFPFSTLVCTCLCFITSLRLHSS